MSKNKIINGLVIALWSILLLAAVYLLYINFKSLKIQRVVKQETMTGKLKLKSDYIISRYPDFPNITVVAEPVAVQKARYLINEKKYDKARALLKSDNSNPFDGRKEYFTAVSFYNEKEYDSAIFYAKKCQAIKPNFYNNLTILASSYEKTNRAELSLELWEHYLIKNKNHGQAWRVASLLNEKLGNLKKAEQYIDTAKTIFPKDSVINIQYKRIKDKIAFEPYKDIYNKANNLYKQKKYQQAVRLFDEFLSHSPNYTSAHELKSFSLYYLKQYNQCIKQIEQLEKLKDYTLKPNLINLKGVAYFQSGQRTKACEYFTRAKNLGDKDGISNYNKFCKK